MAISTLQEDIEEELLIVGKILSTRDGRLTGNGVITEVLTTGYANLYTVVTDFGNKIVLNTKQIARQFHVEEHSCDFRNMDGRILDQIGLLMRNIRSA